MLSVLLVCTGNICRSPIVQGLLSERSMHLLGGALRVDSAGTWARRGSPPMPEAVQAAAERGADIAELRSSPLTPETAERADLVVTMTAEQREEVLRVAPDADGKVFTLKELVTLLGALPPPQTPPSREGLLDRIAEAHRLRTSSGPPRIVDEDVADPLGMSADVYRAVAWETEGLVDALVERLAGPADRREARASAGG